MIRVDCATPYWVAIAGGGHMEGPFVSILSSSAKKKVWPIPEITTVCLNPNTYVVFKEHKVT